MFHEVSPGVHCPDSPAPSPGAVLAVTLPVPQFSCTGYTCNASAWLLLIPLALRYDARISVFSPCFVMLAAMIGCTNVVHPPPAYNVPVEP